MCKCASSCVGVVAVVVGEVVVALPDLTRGWNPRDSTAPSVRVVTTVEVVMIVAPVDVRSSVAMSWSPGSSSNHSSKCGSNVSRRQPDPIHTTKETI